MSKHMKRMVFFSFHYNTGSVSLRDGNFLLFILNSSPSLEDYLDLTSHTTCQVPGRIKYSSAGFQWYPKETFYLVIIPCQQTILSLCTFASCLGTVLLIPIHPYLLCCIFVWICFLEIGSHSVTPANLEFTT